ncbi:Uncharacterised protein [Mycobacteroides abscessus subsp. abscessus]|nr:Uncharacterised protein [Mycobacteroides abscessus subsp. abscessus]
MTTSTRMRSSEAKSLVREPSILATTCGASMMPATAPKITPTKDIREPSAPERHPDTAAMKATAMTPISSHCDGFRFIPTLPGARPAAHQDHEGYECPMAAPSRTPPTSPR